VTKRLANPTPPVPGWASIATGTILASMVVSATVVIGWTVVTWGDVLMLAVGIFSSAAMVGYVILMVARRSWAQLEAREAELEQAVLVPDELGTWAAGPRAPGAVLYVRWSYETGSYWIQGWVSDNWQIGEELEWTDLETLSRLLAEAELDGLVPADDGPTARIRSRLNVDRLGGDRIQNLGIWPR
jgi:hypothetical protein